MKKTKKLSINLGIISLVLFVIYIINNLIFFISGLKEHLYSENSNYYNWRFGKVYYTKKGTGSPLLLIHDLECTSSSYEWREIINHLSSKHTVYAIDLIGCGKSDKPKITYTNFMYVQLITDIIKNVIKHKVDVVATGKSSSAVLMACHTDHLLFNNLIMINPADIASLNKFPKTKNKLLKHIIEFPIIGTSYYNKIISKNQIKQKFLESYFFDPNKIKSKYIAAYNEAGHLGGSSSKYLYSSIKSYYTNINIIHALKELNHSIYILSGEYEPNSKEIIASYTNFNPSIESAIIKNTKHLPQLEAPKEITKLIDVYLN